MLTRADLISQFGDLVVALYERVQELHKRGVDAKIIAQFESWGEKIVEDITHLQREYFFVFDKAEALVKTRPSSSPPRRPRPANVVSLRPRRKR